MALKKLDLNADSFRVLLYGYIHGKMEQSNQVLTAEEIIKEFFITKEIEHTDKDLAKFLNLWKGFTGTELYRMYTRNNTSENPQQ